MGSRGLNYYPHHIGDYAKDTAHLSMLEDAAYRRMLDIVYATEKPLPRDQQAIHRLVRARSHAEKLAVDVVLGEFWVEGEDGWHNRRVEEELAKALAEGEESKLKKENEAERQRRHRERRKTLFAQLREHGVVPKWDTSTEELEKQLATLLKRDGHAPVTRDDVPPVTRTATAIHKPVTKSQEPNKVKDEVGHTPDAAHPPGKNGHDHEKTRVLRAQAIELIIFLNEKTGRSYEPVPANVEMIVARMKEGASVEDCKAVVAKKCREWATDEKMSIYLRPATLFNRTKFAQYRGELGAVAA